MLEGELLAWSCQKAVSSITKTSQKLGPQHRKECSKEPAIPLAAFASRKQYNDKIIKCFFSQTAAFLLIPQDVV